MNYALLFLLTAQPPPWVVLPAAPSPAPPAPAPPSDVVRLPADAYYVVELKEPAFVLIAPGGVLNVAQSPGPITMFAKFVGGTGDYEERLFSAAAVVRIRGVGSDKSSATLTLVKVGAKDATDAFQQAFECVGGPRPPPTPPPGPTPPPPPDGTNPFAEAGFRVMVVFDSDNTTRPPAENSVIYGKRVRDYLDAKCAPEPTAQDSNGRAYRIYPANSDISRAPKGWADAFKKAGGKDWVLIGNGTKGYSGPLPKAVDEMLALLSKFGGP